MEKDRQDIKIDKIGEALNSREHHFFKMKHLVFIASFGAFILALAMMLVGLYEAVSSIYHLIISHDIRIFSLDALNSADMFLFGMVMIIFSLGSYNLFVSRLDELEYDSTTNRDYMPKWLMFSNFGELKTLFIKVIILILSINFLGMVIENFHRFTEESLYNMLIVPVGILLIAISLKVIHHDSAE